jgi:hypothetical protein
VYRRDRRRQAGQRAAAVKRPASTQAGVVGPLRRAGRSGDGATAGALVAARDAASADGENSPAHRLEIDLLALQPAQGLTIQLDPALLVHSSPPSGGVGTYPLQCRRWPSARPGHAGETQSVTAWASMERARSGRRISPLAAGVQHGRGWRWPVRLGRHFQEPLISKRAIGAHRPAFSDAATLPRAQDLVVRRQVLGTQVDRFDQRRARAVLGALG